MNRFLDRRIFLRSLSLLAHYGKEQQHNTCTGENKLQRTKKTREFPIYNTHMALLAVFALVCLFSLFTPHSPEPRFSVGVSLAVSHAEIYRNWAITNVGVEKIKLSHLLVQRINEFKMNEIQRKTPQQA